MKKIHKLLIVSTLIELMLVGGYFGSLMYAQNEVKKNIEKKCTNFAKKCEVKIGLLESNFKIYEDIADWSGVIKYNLLNPFDGNIQMVGPIKSRNQEILLNDAIADVKINKNTKNIDVLLTANEISVSNNGSGKTILKNVKTKGNAKIDINENTINIKEVDMKVEIPTMSVQEKGINTIANNTEIKFNAIMDKNFEIEKINNLEYKIASIENDAVVMGEMLIGFSAEKHNKNNKDFINNKFKLALNDIKAKDKMIESMLTQQGLKNNASFLFDFEVNNIDKTIIDNLMDKEKLKTLNTKDKMNMFKTMWINGANIKLNNLLIKMPEEETSLKALIQTYTNIQLEKFRFENHFRTNIIFNLKSKKVEELKALSAHVPLPPEIVNSAFLKQNEININVMYDNSVLSINGNTVPSELNNELYKVLSKLN